MALQTTVDQVDAGVAVVAIEGELDASNYEGLIETVRGLYANGTRRVILDLSGLTYMASSGLVALYSIVQVLRGQEPPDPESGWSAFHALGESLESGASEEEVRLAGVQPSVERVLQRTGMDKLFPTYPDRAAAIAAG
jgi:anti-anti-sigma regulatory factor